MNAAEDSLQGGNESTKRAIKMNLELDGELETIALWMLNPGATSSTGTRLTFTTGSLSSAFLNMSRKSEVSSSVSPKPAHSYPDAENNITGDILTVLDPETIKDIGITTVGQRLSILKAVYLAKLAHNVPFEPDHYIPPCTWTWPLLATRLIFLFSGIR